MQNIKRHYSVRTGIWTKEIVKAVDGATCMERINKDSTRETRSTEFWNDLVQSWWQKFNYGPGEKIHII